MIFNHPSVQDKTLQSVIELCRSEHAFYPCGSRYFGYFTPESDYDFFFGESSDVCAWLTENGFSASQTPQAYMDVNTISTWYNGKVQVMEVRSASNREVVQHFVVSQRKLDSSFRPPKGDRNWWNEQYCRLFPNQYTMPEEVTVEDKKEFREQSRGLIRRA